MKTDKPDKDKSKINMEELVSYCKRRGFVFQASEIYGGIAGFWDYGPYGVELINNLKRAWWKTFVYQNPNIFGLDSAIIQSPKLWEASGHVAGFVDPMIDCKECKHRFRADHVVEEWIEKVEKEQNAPALPTYSESLDVLNEYLDSFKKEISCPNCGKFGTFTSARQFNMMLTTHVGPAEDDTTLTYLRPETAGGIYTNYENVRETTRAKIPFGIAQVGKAFRNEITPRDFVFRTRELEQMEMQYFIQPDVREEEYAKWREFTWNFLLDVIGLSKENISWHEHGEDEKAHYAAAAHDVYYNFPHGRKELCGIHDRTDHDLTSHMKVSGRDLSYFDEASAKRFTPNIIESSMGVGRLFVAVLTEAYIEEEVGDETRVVLKLKSELAPVKVAILPLSKKPELSKVAKEVFASVAGEYNVEYDETQSIGKRYRRQDEIGTPYCVTVDFESIDDQAVTVRDRDSMKQERIKIVELKSYLADKLNLVVR
ncbi:glycine--tRNA ligase [Candidatus Saccharibacteria bacterium]|nr:glycine--tRNA ligase [Candidatus Saccharibacteria bacterium]